MNSHDKQNTHLANGYRRPESISLRVAINKFLLEFLINFLCLFHVIVIVIIELNLMSCAQWKINASGLRVRR